MPAPGVAPPGLGCHGAKRRPGARAPGSTISPLRGSREMPPPERKRARRGAARTEKTDQSGRSDQDQPFVSLAVPAVSGVGARVQTTSVIGHTPRRAIILPATNGGLMYLTIWSLSRR